MKKFIFILIISSLSTFAKCQGISRKHFNYKNTTKQSSLDLKRQTLQGVAPQSNNHLIILLTPSVPFSFGQVQKDNSDKWQVSPAVSLGTSYSLVVGKGYKDATDPDTKPVQVEPYFTIGAYINVGVSQNVQTVGGGGAIGNLNLGGILGLYKYINLLVAYDALNSKGVYGIGARVDIFTFAQGAGSVILNKKDF